MMIMLGFASPRVAEAPTALTHPKAIKRSIQKFISGKHTRLSSKVHPGLLLDVPTFPTAKSELGPGRMPTH